MGIQCLADAYIVKEKDEFFYVYNELYEGSQKGLFWASVIGLFLPEASDYYIPICIEIKKTQDEVTIGKKLDVIGTNDFKYFVAKHQYEKWKHTYGLAIKIVILLSVLMNVTMGYLFWKSSFVLAMGISFGCVFLLSLGAVIKLEMTNWKRKKHEIVDVAFL